MPYVRRVEREVAAVDSGQLLVGHVEPNDAVLATRHQVLNEVRAYESASTKNGYLHDIAFENCKPVVLNRRMRVPRVGRSVCCDTEKREVAGRGVATTTSQLR